MNNNPAQVAARARAERRKRLQQRQTVIFGVIITGLLAIALFAGAVWANIIPAPFAVEINSPTPEEVPQVAQPCPPDGAMPVAYGEIKVNVLNSTKISGLGARIATELGSRGVSVESIGNSEKPYPGTAQIISGAEHLDMAYTIAALFSDAQIVVDARTEEIVDIVLGPSFNDLIEEELVALDPDAPIPPPSGCIPLVDDDEDAGNDETDGDEDNDDSSEAGGEE